ncbi:NAD(+) salvage pathway protein [Recurvomyces mirabilis]|nr:NAD(+) salvage pathway protein [Recurvomyces mirabilis]
MSPPTTANSALAIIDLQNDFCPPHGALAVTGGRDIAPAINTLLALPFALKLATRDFHPHDHISFASQYAGKKPFTDSHTIVSPENKEEEQTTLLWPDHCVQGTPGCELILELRTSSLDLVVNKGQDKRVESYSAFGPPFRRPRVGMTELDAKLKEKGIEHVFVCGLAWDFCVQSTAVDAVEHGYSTYVIEELTKGVDRSEDGHEKTKAEMEKGGVKVIGLDSLELAAIRKK